MPRRSMTVWFLVTWAALVLLADRPPALVHLRWRSTESRGESE